MVATLVRTIFEQPDAEQVWAQHARVVEQLEGRFADAAAMLVDAAGDILAFAAFPVEHWSAIRSNNPQERLNKELRRRTDVVGIFPNRAAIVRLVGAVLAEQHDEWAVARRYMSADSLTRARLRVVADDDTTDPQEVNPPELPAAVEADGSRRDGAWLVELTDLLEHCWGERVRVIAGRERPPPGAQLTLFDTAEGFRHQVFITDRTDPDIAALELRHRHRAHVENRIRAAKDSGLRNLPCEDFVRNEAWLQLVLCAQDLHAWAQALCFDGALAVAEPKKLRHRVWHAAAVVAHTARQTIVRFQRTWPWTTDIVIAFRRLRVALPG
jgi:hypothetical protein